MTEYVKIKSTVPGGRSIELSGGSNANEFIRIESISVVPVYGKIYQGDIITTLENYSVCGYELRNVEALLDVIVSRCEFITLTVVRFHPRFLHLDRFLAAQHIYNPVSQTIKLRSLRHLYRCYPIYKTPRLRGPENCELYECKKTIRKYTASERNFFQMEKAGCFIHVFHQGGCFYGIVSPRSDFDKWLPKDNNEGSTPNYKWISNNTNGFNQDLTQRQPSPATQDQYNRIPARTNHFSPTLSYHSASNTHSNCEECKIPSFVRELFCGCDRAQILQINITPRNRTFGIFVENSPLKIEEPDKSINVHIYNTLKVKEVLPFTSGSSFQNIKQDDHIIHMDHYSTLRGEYNQIKNSLKSPISHHTYQFTVIRLKTPCTSGFLSLCRFIPGSELDAFDYLELCERTRNSLIASGYVQTHIKIENEMELFGMTYCGGESANRNDLNSFVKVESLLRGFTCSDWKNSPQVDDIIIKVENEVVMFKSLNYVKRLLHYVSIQQKYANIVLMRLPKIDDPVKCTPANEITLFGPQSKKEENSLSNSIDDPCVTVSLRSDNKCVTNTLLQTPISASYNGVENITEFCTVTDSEMKIITTILTKSKGELYGIQLGTDTHGNVIIKGIDEDSIASKDNKLKAGDAIISINGINPRQMPRSSVFEIFKNEENQIWLSVLGKRHS